MYVIPQRQDTIIRALQIQPGIIWKLCWPNLMEPNTVGMSTLIKDLGTAGFTPFTASFSNHSRAAISLVLQRWHSPPGRQPSRRPFFPLAQLVSMSSMFSPSAVTRIGSWNINYQPSGLDIAKYSPVIRSRLSQSLMLKQKLVQSIPNDVLWWKLCLADLW